MAGLPTRVMGILTGSWTESVKSGQSTSEDKKVLSLWGLYLHREDGCMAMCLCGKSHRRIKIDRGDLGEEETSLETL